MPAASSAHTGAEHPNIDPRIGERLRAQLQQAEQHAAELQAEHHQLLADPDAIQEDRDATALLLEHARHQLTAARAAVARVDDGTYGTCSRCGGEIEAERLAVLADVTTCVRCAG